MSTEGFGAGFDFLFSFDFSKITGESLVVALGHAFFTLSLGMGAIMAYGAYMPKDASIGKTVITVAFLDTLIALVAGLVIFPIVFSNGLEAGAGPGLLFQTLPLAFSQMPAGTLFGTLFFVLVAFAALSSAISLGEPVVAWAVESKGMSRLKAASLIGFVIWLLGIGTILSFNEWADFKIFGKTIFDTLDFLTANIMLPLGGLLIAVFVGWKMKEQDVIKELEMKSPLVFDIWRIILKFIAPIAIAIVLINGLVK
jgi:NSS family neurotransmitter:Na+ symporter